MNYEIIPLRGVGNILFGTGFEDVRILINSDFESFKKTPMSKFPCDSFKSVGTYCFYDINGLLDALEFVRPARPSLNGVQLLGLTFGSARAMLARFDDRLRESRDGIFADQIGVSVYAPLAKNDPEAPIESALAYRFGYFLREG